MSSRCPCVSVAVPSQHTPQQNVHDMFVEHDDQSFIAKLNSLFHLWCPRANFSKALKFEPFFADEHFENFVSPKKND